MDAITMATFASQSQTTCGSLLRELHIIWDEIGEGDNERDTMLLELEQECLDIYRRKVEKTRKYKADLNQSLAHGETEIAQLVSALGDHTSFSRVRGTLKHQLSSIEPILSNLKFKKEQRIKEISDYQLQIVKISAEIAGDLKSTKSSNIKVDEDDLTLKKLGDLKSRLQELQNEKALRLRKVNNYIGTVHELSSVMSLDFFKTVSDVHPSLADPTNGQSKSISNDTIASLTSLIHSLQQDKQERLQKLQGLGRELIELWNLMDIPIEEQRKFDHVTSIISFGVDELLGKGYLAQDVIDQTELEVEHLNVLKLSKMKELVFKRQNELEEIYRGVHIDVDSDAAQQILLSLIESGNIDLSDLLSSMEDQIAKAREEALSRKEILDKIEKWKHASEEEKWLDEYEMDENRYSAGRGAHINLKRAEKARILVNRLSSIVEMLTTKIKAWEAEKGIPFLYDKIHILHSLETDSLLRSQREEEKRRYREQKRLKEQHVAEQEALYGSTPATKKPLGQSVYTNNLLGTPNRRRMGTLAGRQGPLSSGKERRESDKPANPIPLNYVALAKDGFS